MSNIGRNDPCTCGSGKKFKKCCWLKQAPPVSPATPLFANKQLDENSVFTLIKAKSAPFQKFYTEKRGQMSKFIVVHDPNLPVGVRARVTRTNGHSYLRLRTMICPLEDATLIAHELGHLIQDEQGFPHVAGLNDHPAASALNSALHDPLVDATLDAFGFDRRADLWAEIEENKRQLKSVLQAPSEPAGKAHWIANCLGHILNQHVLGDDPTESAFLEWFSSRYPQILAEANNIANAVIAIGFDTPDKMFAALEQARALLNAGGGVIGPPTRPASHKL
jgi:hypothetical protein